MSTPRHRAPDRLALWIYVFALVEACALAAAMLAFILTRRN